MMRNTASIQVNLDIGRELEIEMRWKRAHDLGPVLAAAFANSPLDAYGSPTGWRSTRLAVWQAIDPDRTDSAFVAGLDARSAWTRYTLDAPVMMIRGDDGSCTPLDVRLPFGGVDRQRARARLAHARRLRATTSPRCSRPCAHAAGSSSA